MRFGSLAVPPRVLPALLFLASCGSAPDPADLILTGGKIVTVDQARPEVRALAARDGVIVAVGSEEEIARFRGPDTRVIELADRLAVPGFVEGHGHFNALGRSKMTVELRSARSWDEIVERVAAAARTIPAGTWIEGRGWHQEKWDGPPSPTVEGFPVHDGLSRATPDHPVVLGHASGHAVMVNARALEAAGIDAATPDPPGGEILRDRAGRATGLLRETAENLVGAAHAAARQRRSPAEFRAELDREVELASAECLAKGVTSFQDAGASFDTIRRLREAAADGRLGVRLWVMIGEDDAAIEREGADYPVIGEAGERITVRAIKRSLDGALGSRGAWLLEPYADAPGSTGMNTNPVETLAATADLAARRGLQLCVHAIGDRANREALDVFEAAFAAHPELRDPRWRIEHAQHLAPQDVPRFAGLGVVASMQAVHCTSDGPWVPSRLGEARAAEGAYLWRSLIDSGALVSNGTDAPVEDVDPIANFHAAVTRRMADGRTFHPAEAMTREEALRSATLEAARAAFEETRKGSLTPGKLADVVVLSRDLLTVDADEIRGTEVLYTIVGGEVVYTHPRLR